MSNTPTKEDFDKYHKWFAVECNNRGWSLACRDRTADEDLEFRNAAHGVMLHWSAVGTELHRMRALSLLAHAHASCGLGATALPWAQQCTAYFTARETEPWELAFTHMIHAQAAHAASNAAVHSSQYALAEAIIDGMPEDENKEIVMMSWPRIPTP